MAGLGSELVGRRVVLRSVVPGETGPSGGPALTDVIGRLISYTDEVVEVERRDGSLVQVPTAGVVATKVVPDGPQRRRTRPAQDFEPEELMAICTRGWPPTESAPLGDWLLRAAGGFTGRANSAAVHGEPERAFGDALRAVEQFYGQRELPARAQVISGSPWEQAFGDAGWTPFPASQGTTLVQVADLTGALLATDDPVSRAEVRETIDDDWTTMYHRTNGASQEDVRGVLEGPPTVGFVRLGDPLAAIGRVTVTGEWAGLSCVEVRPELRRGGLARQVVDASLRWASEHGADKAYLQVESDNEAARALYAPYGFTDHHEYLYLSP